MSRLLNDGDGGVRLANECKIKIQIFLKDFEKKIQVAYVDRTSQESVTQSTLTGTIWQKVSLHYTWSKSILLLCRTVVKAIFIWWIAQRSMEKCDEKLIENEIWEVHQEV